MDQFDTSHSWGYRHITALENPISEFNARGGLDLELYQEIENHISKVHPTLGKDEWLRIKEELPAFDIVEDPKSGQKIRIQKFNWPSDGFVAEQNVTIMNMAFSVPIDMAHVQYQNYLVAKELGTPFVVFENPSYGDSDKLTQSQRSALKKGNFGLLAMSMLGVATKLGIKKTNFMGYSMGAETAAAMAAHACYEDFKIQVENIFLMEAPRIKTHKPLRLDIDFINDASNLKFTWRHPLDPVLREVCSLKPALPKDTLAYAIALTKGGLENDIRAALDNQPNMRLIIASAGASKISPSSANDEVFLKLCSEYPNRSIRRIIIPGEGHAYGDSGIRYAQLGKLMLRNN